jgi:hypothetical protein
VKQESAGDHVPVDERMKEKVTANHLPDEQLEERERERLRGVLSGVEGWCGWKRQDWEGAEQS